MTKLSICGARAFRNAVCAVVRLATGIARMALTCTCTSVGRSLIVRKLLDIGIGLKSRILREEITQGVDVDGVRNNGSVVQSYSASGKGAGAGWVDDNEADGHVAVCNGWED